MSTGSRTPDQFIADILSPDFVETYYGHLAPEDAAAYPPEELPARVEAHLRVGLTRGPGEAVVRVEPSGANAVAYVVTDDMPFLVDSVAAEIVRQKHGINLVVHPILVATRSRETHELTALRPVPTHAPVASGDTAALADLSQFFDGSSHSRLESWIAIEIGGSPDEEQTALLVAGIERVLADVKVCVEDWQAMRNKAHEIADNLGWVHGADSIQDLHTASDLLRWLADGNFTFLGYREYDLATRTDRTCCAPCRARGLGILRARPVGRPSVAARSPAAGRAREGARARAADPHQGQLALHRAPAGLPRLRRRQDVRRRRATSIGERRFLGLFTSARLHASRVRRVPVLRRKVDEVLEAAGFAPDSHAGKDLLEILETYPRDELFQIRAEELHDDRDSACCPAGAPRLRLFLRRGRVRALHLLPRLPAARPLHHRRAAADRGRSCARRCDGESMDFERCG